MKRRNSPAEKSPGAIGGKVRAAEEGLRRNNGDPPGDRQQREISEEGYRKLFENMLEGVAYCRMIYDSEGVPEDFIYLNVNAAFDRIIGTTTVINRRVTEVFPGIRGAFPELFATYGRVALTGVPEAFDLDFRPSGKWLHISAYSPAKGYFVAVFEDITGSKHTAQVTSLMNRIYAIAQTAGSIHGMLDQCVEEFRAFSGCEAVGIRILDEEGNIPYQAYCGFPPSFYEKETPLSIKSDECMCIYVITGQINRNLPVATPGGSFYCNGTSKFLATISDEEKGRTRNVCNQMGYESVALIPIRTPKGILGLVQFNDHREDMVPLELVRTIEDISLPLGEAIRRLQAEDAMRDSEEKFRRLYENSMDAILLTSPDGTILAVNPAACAMFQRTEEEMLHKGRDLIVDATDPRLREAMEERTRTGRFVGELTLVRKDGTRFTGEVSSSLFSDRRGDARTGLIIRDISRRREQERGLRIANRKLNLMNMVTSHDIYNKIIGIRGYIDLSRDYVTDPRGEKYLSGAEKILRELQQLLSDTQKYQKMEQEQPRWNNLGTLLANIRSTGVAGSIPLANETGNLEIFADPIIEKVFWHLLDNSAKHGESVTEIRLSVRKSGSVCTLVYEDNGVGIPESKRPDLFTKSFGKVTGFDLFFVHDLLDISGMEIQETGEPGKGARFVITIPRELCRFAGPA
jgi:PAS domain S-box-containing protein